MSGPRVLHVINSLGAGGAERSLQELLPALESRGVRSQIACMTPTDHGVQHAVAAGWPISWIGSGQLAGVRRLRLLLKDADIVHSSLFEADQMTRLAGWGLPVRVVSNLVNTPYVEARRADPGIHRGRLAAVRVIDGLTSRHLTDHFIAITEAVKQHSVENLRIRPGRVDVIPRGRDPRRLVAVPDAEVRELRRSLGILPGEAMILNVGRQEYQKGQVTLLEALARLLPRVPGAKLVIAGRPGNASSRLRQTIESLQLCDRVAMPGHVENVPALLKAADLFAFPSLYEGLGGSLIEAMALGVPIVASDIPAIAETTPHMETAVLVPPMDPDALASAIERVASDANLRHHLGTAGVRRFHARYTLDQMADSTAALYERLLAPSVRR